MTCENLQNSKMQLSNEQERSASPGAWRAPTYNEKEIFVPQRDRAKLCKGLRPGAKVLTDYSGRVTPHTITETDTWRNCESGLAFKVTPPVPRSAGSWMDSGWFIPAES